MKTKLILAAALLCGGIIAAGAPSGAGAAETKSQTSSQKSGNKASSGCPDRAVQAQAGGTGSPVAAGSMVGSTDRTPPNARGASGTSGQGTTASGRPC